MFRNIIVDYMQAGLYFDVKSNNAVVSVILIGKILNNLLLIIFTCVIII